MGRLLGILAGLLWLIMPASAVAQAPRDVVRVIATDFVLPGKITRLDGWAEAQGLDVEGLYVEKERRPAAAWFAGAALVVLDTPRGNDMAAVMGRLGGVQEATATPWLRVGGGPPAFGGGLPAEVGRRLAAYYGAGGEANLQTFFAYYAAWRAGGDLSKFPPPQALPKSGLYHPDAPRLFSGVEDYLAWAENRWSAQAPRLGVITYAGAMASAETSLLDSVVRSAEAAGVAPFVLWFDGADDQGISKIAAPARLDALVNLQHLQNGETRKAEFEALNIPVLSGFVHREGGIAAWKASPSGVPAQTAAVLMSTPESWGVSDPLVLGAVENGEPVAIPEQVDALIAKVSKLAALRRMAPADKRVTLMFWNHPGGEKNIGASNLNVPRSLAALTDRMHAAGYDVPVTGEQTLIADAQALLAGYYRPETLDQLLARDMAAALPLDAYKTWLARQNPQIAAEVTKRWGAPEAHWAVRRVDDQQVFVIPRLQLGNLMIMPQPPRADRVGESYHDTKVPPGHLYLATYLLMRRQSDALIHFGTHGTQEWTPGKDRGLSTDDYPFLTLGEVPVFYPYIQDNVSEAMQARRRGRAITVSHQTPPFAPAGLYDELRDAHALVHEYSQLEDGPVRDRTADQIRTLAVREGLAADLGWDDASIRRNFPDFMSVLHDHLHALAGTTTPLGLHTFGEPAAKAHRVATVMQQLGRPYYEALGLDPQELFAEDFNELQKTTPYVLVSRRLDGDAMADVEDAKVRALLDRAVVLDRNLAETGEMEALLTALSGGFVRAGPGGDPVRNPEVPSGRNLFSFEPDKLPTKAAYEAGGAAFQKLYEAYRAEHGEAPTKLAFTLWSGEAIRTLGVIESQALHALGLRPVWDEGGRVRRFEIVPSAELGRPRIDVVFQVTSVYRDQFDGFMRLLGGALKRLAALNEPGNAIAANSARVEAELVAAGQAPQEAKRLAALRLFSNAPGDYGSGVPGAVLDSTRWDDDGELADRFLERLQYAYGEDGWGEKPAGPNLFATQLRGVQAAVLSRSSNLHGVLSTDHPFEYLGGLSMAVRRLDGKSPSLFITDSRGGEPRVRSAASFLADELRGRYLNPQWIQAMKAEGYAGTLEVLDVTNNLFGWQVADPEMVRADQWQAMHDTFVADRRKLGLDEWFEKNNPTVQAQLIERLTEAVRKGYWQPDEKTLRELAQRWRELTNEKGAQAGDPKTTAVLQAALGGFGLSAPTAASASPQAAPTPPAEAAPSPASDIVRGEVLEKVAPPAPPTPAPLSAMLGLAMLLLLMGLGGLRQLVDRSSQSLPELSHARP